MNPLSKVANSRLIEIDDELNAALKEIADVFKEQGKCTLNSNVDPEFLADGITLSGYHIENGARSFADYAKAVVDDMGDMVKPYLKSWYMGIKYDPRAANFEGMSSAAEVESADIDAIFLIDQEQTQDNTLKWWWPQTTEEYQVVLAVQTTESEMTPQLHNLLMESKLRRLVQEDENPKETMMMSVEHLPEMYQIAQETEVSNYATAIMYSDSMGALMSKIIWPLEKTEILEEQQETIQEWTEGQTLMDVLEKM